LKESENGSIVPTLEGVKQLIKIGRDEILSFTNESPPEASEGGPLLVRELDERLGLSAFAHECVCTLTRTGIGGKLAAGLEWAI
jgi:hypothetical protein